MASEPLTLHAAPGKTVYYRLFRPVDDKVFDFDDDTWEANLAACADPKLAATEKTDVGDAANSLYTALLDLAILNDTDTPMQVVVQAMDDLGTDVILSWLGFWIANGQMLGKSAASNVIQIGGASTPATVLGKSMGAVVAGAAITGTLTTTVFTTNLTEATSNHFGNTVVQMVCAFLTGVLTGQSRPIVGYNGGTKTITVSPGYTEPPANLDEFVILGIVA